MSQIPLPPTGSELTCKGWHQEAALRCLLNNLHPEVAEDRDNLIVYGGNGQAARNPKALADLITALKNLENNETLIVQSGKPVAVFPSNPQGPRVLIANSNLVPQWATWDHFNKLKDEGLMMYGQMTAGSWIYIGSQGILQGTYETFMAAARKHYGEQATLKGKLVLTAGRKLHEVVSNVQHGLAIELLCNTQRQTRPDGRNWWYGWSPTFSC